MLVSPSQRVAPEEPGLLYRRNPWSPVSVLHANTHAYTDMHTHTHAQNTQRHTDTHVWVAYMHACCVCMLCVHAQAGAQGGVWKEKAVARAVVLRCRCWIPQAMGRLCTGISPIVHGRLHTNMRARGVAVVHAHAHTHTRAHADIHKHPTHMHEHRKKTPHVHTWK